MTALNDKLLAATRDNKLWVRDPVLQDVGWQHVGHANNLSTFASLQGKLFFATAYVGFQGTWRGKCETGDQAAGMELVLKEDSDGRLRGTWAGTPLVGQRLGRETF